MRAGVIGIVVAATALAHADSPGVARIVASGDCKLSDLETRSNELLGRAAIVADANASIGIATSIQDAGRVSATLTFADAAGVARSARTVEAATCDEMVDSLAVVISLLLRDGVHDDAPVAPTAAVSPAPSPPPVQVTETTFVVLPPHASRPALELAAQMGTTKTGEVVIGGRLDRGRHAFGAELHVGIPATTSLGTQEGDGSVRVMTLSLGGVVCRRWGSLGACGILMGGLVRGSGADLMDARTAVRPMASVGARLEWRQAMSRWGGIRMFVDAEQLMVSTRFLVDEMPVWTSDARQAWLGAGIYFHGP